MKKLTAGIFATILGLTAMGAADAAIPTQNYVDEAVGSVRSTVTQMALNLDNYATKTYADQAEADAISSAKSYTDSEIGEIGDMTVKAYVDAAKNEATYDDTALAGRVTTAEGKITAAEGKITTIEGQQTTQDAAIKALQDANYAPQATTYTKTEVDNLITASEYDDTALAARVGANETAIGTLNTEQDTQDAAIKALQDAGYITNAALTGYATEAYADQAEADAISTAAADATTKANKALEDAKAYADANDADTIYDDTELTAEVGKKINTPTVACSDPDGCVLMADGTWQGVVNTYVGEEN